MPDKAAAPLPPETEAGRQQLNKALKASGATPGQRAALRDVARAAFNAGLQAAPYSPVELFDELIERLEANPLNLDDFKIDLSGLDDAIKAFETASATMR